MEPVGGISAIASLIVIGGRLSAQARSFMGKVKDAPLRVSSIQSDLIATTNILKNIEAALQRPIAIGVFSLEHARDDFESVIETLMQVFNKLSKLMEKV